MMRRSLRLCSCSLIIAAAVCSGGFAQARRSGTTEEPPRVLAIDPVSFGSDPSSGPALAAEAAVSVDVLTGEIIYARDVDRRRYPASTTKILTAMLLEEQREREDALRYSALAKATHPYILDLSVGDTLSAAACMDALLLYSANDVAVMIAEEIGGGIAGFAAAMNRKARLLGLKNSRFGNPHGLHDPEHYTTAFDMALLGLALPDHSWVLESMGKTEAEIVSGSGLRYTFDNRNKLIGLDGCIAGKTGFTDEAGRCLLALYERDGRKVLGVLLKSVYDSRDTVVFRDMEALMAWSYEAEREILYEAGEKVAQTRLAVKLLPVVGPTRELVVPLLVKEQVRIYPEGKRLHAEIGVIDPWRLDPEEPVGRLVVEGRIYRAAFDLFPRPSWKDILRDNPGFYIPAACGLLFLLAGVAALAVRGRKR